MNPTLFPASEAFNYAICFIWNPHPNSQKPRLGDFPAVSDYPTQSHRCETKFLKRHLV